MPDFTITVVNTSLEEKQTTNKPLTLFTIIVLRNCIWSFKCLYVMNVKLQIYICQNVLTFSKRAVVPIYKFPK